MWSTIIALLPFLLAVPDLRVDFSDPKLEDINVRVVGKDELLDKCLKSGYMLQYDFEVRLCRRRPLWLDSCPKQRLEKHKLSFDPISGIFTLDIDRFGDSRDPGSLSFASIKDAYEGLSEVKNLSLQFLARDRFPYLEEPERYISIRVTSECRGDFNKTLARISSFLTLGLVRVSGFDTGWLDFNLQPADAK